MINEIFISKWTSPVVPIPCMTPAQLDNELERIFERLTPRVEADGFRDNTLRFKRDPDREFDRGFEAGVKSDLYAVMPNNEKFWEQGYETGYAAGRDAEAHHRDKSL